MSSRHRAGKRRVIFFGRTGAGKSSTINALFGLTLPTDNAVSCTRGVEQYAVEHGVMFDTPGLGESLEKDAEYLPQYQTVVGEVDHVVWLLQADTRTYRADQQMLREIAPHIPAGVTLTLGINHADQIGPGGWDALNNRPSPQQEQSIRERVADAVAKLSKIVPLCGEQVVVYSALRGYGLDRLRARLFPTLNQE